MTEAPSVPMPTTLKTSNAWIHIVFDPTGNVYSCIQTYDMVVTRVVLVTFNGLESIQNLQELDFHCTIWINEPCVDNQFGSTMLQSVVSSNIRAKKLDFFRSSNIWSSIKSLMGKSISWMDLSEWYVAFFPTDIFYLRFTPKKPIKSSKGPKLIVWAILFLHRKYRQANVWPLNLDKHLVVQFQGLSRIVEQGLTDEQHPCAQRNSHNFLCFRALDAWQVFCSTYTDQMAASQLFDRLCSTSPWPSTYASHGRLVFLLGTKDAARFLFFAVLVSNSNDWVLGWFVESVCCCCCDVLGISSSVSSDSVTTEK